ncbi:MAG: DUF5662 family protein [bacterium]
MYDSTQDTLKHIETINILLEKIIVELNNRCINHDKSKLQSPEKEAFDIYTPKLKDVTYGSDKYKQYLAELDIALKHHYSHNRHHPEHFENGINGMTLIDIIEMLADWKAATLRHNDGSIIKSLEINKKRFNLSDDLYIIMLNTVKYLEWE